MTTIDEDGYREVIQGLYKLRATPVESVSNYKYFTTGGIGK